MHTAHVLLKLMEFLFSIHDGNIINPFYERFTTRYLVNVVGRLLSTINKHFDNNSKDHYVRRSVVSIGHTSEIAGSKESKLNVCNICFNHCAL